MIVIFDMCNMEWYCSFCGILSVDIYLNGELVVEVGNFIVEYLFNDNIFLLGCIV